MSTPASTTEFSDQDLRAMLNRALRTVTVAALVGIPVVWLAWGWRSAVLFLVGGAVAATGILEWRRIMSAILTHLDAGAKPRPIVRVLLWFFLRILLAAGVLYVSLRGLDGKVAALIIGLALAMVALLIEAIRLFHSWTF